MNIAELKVEDLELIHFADERMKTPPPKFDFSKDRENAKKLVELLYGKMRLLNGVGLAANQVGLPYRVFVYGDRVSCRAIFNPVVLGVSEKKIHFEEGCLSYPGLFINIQRPKDVRISFQDETGKEYVEDHSNLVARIILHEYDHMEGLNFTMHSTPWMVQRQIKRLMLKEARQEKRKKVAEFYKSLREGN